MLLFPGLQSIYEDTYFFIDTAQDLSTFELVVFKMINKQRIMLAGDVNQNIFNHNNFSNWDKITEFLDGKFHQLTYNWHSTKQIVKEATPFLLNANYKNEGVISGYPIKQKIISDFKELSTIFEKGQLIDKVKALPPGKSLGIITLNKVQLELVTILHQHHLKKLGISIFRGSGIIPKNKAVLTSIDYVKGLEFHATYVIIPHQEEYSDSDKTRIYTSLTRTTDDLTVVYIEV